MCLCSVLSLIVLHVSVQFLCVIYHISLAHFYCWAHTQQWQMGMDCKEKGFLLRILSHSWVVGLLKACCLKSPAS